MTLTNQSDPQQHPNKVKCVFSISLLALSNATAKLISPSLSIIVQTN